MPLPTAEKGESKEEFMNRCMGDDAMNAEFPGQSQRMGVCNTQWSKREMSVEYANLNDVEVFKEGVWNNRKITAADIDDFVANFKTLKNSLVPKLKITHGKDQKSIAGLASYGDVNNVYAKTIAGVRKLFVDLIHVPDEVAQWIKTGRFAERSIEAFSDITIGNKKFRNVLAKVSLLGHEIPAVAGMKPIELADDKDTIKYTFYNIKEEEVIMPETLEALKGEFVDIKDRLDGLKEMKDEAQKAKMFEKLQGDLTTFSQRLADAEKANDNVNKLTKTLAEKEEEIESYKVKDEETKAKIKEQEVDQFVSELKLKGKVVPAFESDVKTLLYNLDDEIKSIDYTIKTEKEGEIEQKISLFDFTKKLFSKMTKVIEYGEIAPAGETNMNNRAKKKTEIYSALGQDYEVVGLDEEAEIEEYMLKHKCSLSNATAAVLDAKEKKERG